MKQSALNLLMLCLLFFLSGCSDKTACLTPVDTEDNNVEVNVTAGPIKPYRLKIRPVIGTRTDDAKIVRDFGVVQKVWITPYVDKNDNLVASHDIYVVVKSPHWVVGEALPVAKKQSGLINPAGKVPFAFRDTEFDEGTELSDENLKNYINDVNKITQQINLLQKLPENKQEDSMKYNKKIREYLDNNRRSKKNIGNANKGDER